MLHEQIPLNNVGIDPINHWKPSNLERISQRFEGAKPKRFVALGDGYLWTKILPWQLALGRRGLS